MTLGYEVDPTRIRLICSSRDLRHVSAFLLGRRAATHAYTNGYGRAEDLACIVIVLVIASPAVAAGWTGVYRLLHPAPVSHLAYVAAASIVGFVGNEVVARYRIQVASAPPPWLPTALHARTDGFTSLPVVLAAGGAAPGWRRADPASVWPSPSPSFSSSKTPFARSTGGSWTRRPRPVDQAEATLRNVLGVRDVTAVRLRWIGHRLHAEADIVADDHLTLLEAHHIAADASPDRGR